MIKTIYAVILFLIILNPAQAEELNCQQDYPKIIAPDLDQLGQDLKKMIIHLCNKKPIHL